MRSKNIPTKEMLINKKNSYTDSYCVFIIILKHSVQGALLVQYISSTFVKY